MTETCKSFPSTKLFDRPKGGGRRGLTPVFPAGGVVFQSAPLWTGALPRLSHLSPFLIDSPDRRPNRLPFPCIPQPAAACAHTRRRPRPNQPSKPPGWLGVFPLPSPSLPCLPTPTVVPPPPNPNPNPHPPMGTRPGSGPRPAAARAGRGRPKSNGTCPAGSARPRAR